MTVELHIDASGALDRDGNFAHVGVIVEIAGGEGEPRGVLLGVEEARGAAVALLEAIDAIVTGEFEAEVRERIEARS